MNAGESTSSTAATAKATAEDSLADGRHGCGPVGRGGSAMAPASSLAASAWAAATATVAPSSSSSSS
eukprot:CAMPEP_0183815116 /NCGR_PEP_ID=MMETSP0803_2-20130417/56266_1 /TAXON_ID=195967 /ORGANISM="Crustomastix stigmata, Strain CCMP3273" /LENGTH=66 /DNA_ID=CAMNT_0026059981 /DNA_START=85 /DNA_END=281 /DNA_ORIENTATION=-